MLRLHQLIQHRDMVKACFFSLDLNLLTQRHYFRLSNISQKYQHSVFRQDRFKVAGRNWLNEKPAACKSHQGPVDSSGKSTFFILFCTLRVTSCISLRLSKTLTLLVGFCVLEITFQIKAWAKGVGIERTWKTSSMYCLVNWTAK